MHSILLRNLIMGFKFSSTTIIVTQQGRMTMGQIVTQSPAPKCIQPRWKIVLINNPPNFMEKIWWLQETPREIYAYLFKDEFVDEVSVSVKKRGKTKALLIIHSSIKFKWEMKRIINFFFFEDGIINSLITK